jgi:hypothetical protein
MRFSMWSVVCFRQIGQSGPPSSSSSASAAAPATSSTLSTSHATQNRNAILVSNRQVRLFGISFAIKLNSNGHILCFPLFLSIGYAL